MKPSLRRFGKGQHLVLVIDHFNGDPQAIVALAAALAPFPYSEDTYYPGVRRHLKPGDGAAFAYAESVIDGVSDFIGDVFGCEWFDWIEASFSMITAAPDSLIAGQRTPHFDSTDRNYLAILHYLSDTEGTAFYRQRATGIEMVDTDNVAAFVESARQTADEAHGYIHGSDAHYEEIGRVEGVADRLVMYRGALLHSGLIAPGAKFSDDPRVGRLTANLFGRGR